MISGRQVATRPVVHHARGSDRRSATITSVAVKRPSIRSKRTEMSAHKAHGASLTSIQSPSATGRSIQAKMIPPTNSTRLFAEQKPMPDGHAPATSGEVAQDQSRPPLFATKDRQETHRHSQAPRSARPCAARIDSLSWAITVCRSRALDQTRGRQTALQTPTAKVRSLRGEDYVRRRRTRPTRSARPHSVQRPEHPRAPDQRQIKAARQARNHIDKIGPGGAVCTASGETFADRAVRFAAQALQDPSQISTKAQSEVSIGEDQECRGKAPPYPTAAGIGEKMATPTRSAPDDPLGTERPQAASPTDNPLVRAGAPPLFRVRMSSSCLRHDGFIGVARSVEQNETRCAEKKNSAPSANQTRLRSPQPHPARSFQQVK